MEQLSLLKPRVYVAGPFVHKDNAADVAQLFEDAGFEITRDWWQYESEEGHDLTELAIEDVRGVVTADFVVVLNTTKSEGKAVETGIAMALMKMIVLVGEPSNIFHHLDSILKVKTAKEAVEKCSQAWGEFQQMMAAQEAAAASAAKPVGGKSLVTLH